MGAIAAAVIAAAATAGTAVYSSQQSKNAAKKAREASMVSSPDARKAFGGKPHAALYEPVNIDKTQLDSILSNRAALDDTSQLMKTGNNVITQDALRRASALIPGYRQSMEAYGAGAGALLHGEIPYQDVLGIIGDRAGLAGKLGIPGTAGNATLKDLGMSRMDALKTGGGMLQDMVGIAERVSPRNDYLTPKEFLISPADRVKTNIAQNELLQQSQQNYENLKAGGDPAARATLEANLAAQGNRGGNYSAAITAAAQGASELIGGIGQYYKGRSSGGLNSSTGFYGSEASALKAGGSGATASYYGGAGGPAASGGYYINPR